MKDKLLKILEEVYDLSEEEEEKAFADILKIANAQPDGLSQIVKDLEQDNVSVVYEALAKDMENWGGFFLDEAKRIIETAKKSKEPGKILKYLDEFIFIEPDEFKYSKELVELMKSELKNQQPAFRYWAMNLMVDFRDESNIFIKKLIEDRLSDPDWRIRYWAYVLLKELNSKGKYKLSFMDKIRAKTHNPYTFH